MKQTNPYASPPLDTRRPQSAADAHLNPDQLERLAAELLSLRDAPPSAARLLLKKTGPAFAAALAFFVTTMILFLLPPSAFRTQLTIGFCGFCLGIVVRDLAYIHNFAKWWPANAYFIDWNRVGSFDCSRPGKTS